MSAGSSNPFFGLTAYELRHAVSHLLAAGHLNELHQVLGIETYLSGNAWYEVNLEHNEISAYFGGIQEVWEAARHEGAMATQLRCAFTTTSVRSLSIKVPEELVGALVECGSWRSEQALSHVFEIPFALGRSKALAALAPHLSDSALASCATVLGAQVGDAKGEAVDPASEPMHLSDGMAAIAIEFAKRGYTSNALDALCLVRHPYVLAEALPQVARYAHGDVLQELSRIGQEIDSPYLKAKALVSIANTLKEPARTSILNEAWQEALRDPRGEAIADQVGLRVAAGRLREVLSAVASIEIPDTRARALVGIASVIQDQHHRNRLLAEALEWARRAEYVVARLIALVSVADCCPERERDVLLDEAVSMAVRIRDAYVRTQALRCVLPSIVRSGRPMLAVEIALGDSRRRIDLQVISELAALLPEKLLCPLLVAIRAARLAWNQVHDRPKAFSVIALRLANLGSVTDALSLAREIDDRWLRAETLTSVAKLLPVQERIGLLTEAVSAARFIGEEYHWPEALAALAPHLSERSLTEAFGNAKRVSDDHTKSRLLNALISAVPLKLVSEVVEEAGRLPPSDEHIMLLAAAAKRLPDSQRVSLLSTALEMINAVDSGPVPDDGNDYLPSTDEYRKAVLLYRLVPFVPSELLDRVCETAQGLREDYPRALALSSIAAHMPLHDVERIISKAEMIQTPNERERALAGLLPRLGELGHTKRALDLVTNIHTELWRAEALGGLVRHLPESFTTEIVRLAVLIGDEYLRASIFRSPGVLSRSRTLAILVLSRGLSDPYHQSTVLLGLLQGAPKELRDNVMAEALSTVGLISQEHLKSWYLTKVASSATRRETADIFGMTEKLLNDQNRAEVLAAIAGALPLALISRTLELAHEMKDRRSEVRVLLALLPYVDDARRPDVWDEVLHLLAEDTRDNFLSSVSSLLESARAVRTIGIPELIFEAIQDARRWWS